MEGAKISRREVRANELEDSRGGTKSQVGAKVQHSSEDRMHSVRGERKMATPLVHPRFIEKLKSWAPLGALIYVPAPSTLPLQNKNKIKIKLGTHTALC